MDENKQEGQVMTDHRYTANEMFKEKDLLFRFQIRQTIEHISDFLQREEAAKILREEADRISNAN